MAHGEDARGQRHRRWSTVLAVGVLGLVAVAGCAPTAEYDDARAAYQETGEQRAAADKRLTDEAAAITSVPGVGTPEATSYARCSATSARNIGSSHTVSCVAKRSLTYRVSTADASPDSLWAAETAAVRAVVDQLDQAGWDRDEWGDQLDQALADRGYDPYPVGNGTETKKPLDVQLYLVDRRWHDPGAGYTDSERIVSMLEGSDAGAIVVVVFGDSYVTDSPCDDCADREPTAWPTR